MATGYPRLNHPSTRTRNQASSDGDVNILLLGQTGVGKSTFINALASYLAYDTLQEAVSGHMVVVVPSAFAHTVTVNDEFEERRITIGREDDFEKFSTRGESATLQCRSFIFPIGNRKLRLIDTPGIGDTRGIEQDEKNFHEILTFIAQYKHLNAIFILMKPNETRLSILFRFSINELLRHLHVTAKANLMFVYTNARSTFYMPGPSKQILEALLKKHHENQGVEVPFSRANMFLFDNESFRYLALRKNNMDLSEEQVRSCEKSWDVSVKEYARLMQTVNQCPPHSVRSTLSLNEAEQLIRKLPRPMAETARLIEENIQLARDFQQKVLQNPEQALNGIPQNQVKVITLAHPRTVCVGESCCRVVDNGDGEKRMEYLSVCHEECYLTGVQQETLYDSKLEDCTAMDPRSGDCMVCDCHWLQHIHITYENRAQRVRHQPMQALSLADIDKRISDLRQEENKIQEVYRKLVRFLSANSILPINDDYGEYLEYFIREEHMKQGAGAQNEQLIANLLRIKEQHKNEMDRLKKAQEKGRRATDESASLEPTGIFDLIETLYQLPIVGEQIRQQVEGIRIGQERTNNEREIVIQLPTRANPSKVMEQLTQIISHS